jgi:hypothetical protein
VGAATTALKRAIVTAIVTGDRSLADLAVSQPGYLDLVPCRAAVRRAQ